MEAMEAELDPPPLMKAAFRRNAQARQGWKLMPQQLRWQFFKNNRRACDARSTLGICLGSRCREPSSS